MKSRLFKKKVQLNINAESVMQFPKELEDKGGKDKDLYLYMGNVFIGDRLSAQGIVFDLGNDKYKIVPYDKSDATMKEISDFMIPDSSLGKIVVDSSGQSSRVITATIDGHEYQAAEIIVDLDKNELQIDGSLTQLAVKSDNDRSSVRLGG